MDRAALEKNYWKYYLMLEKRVINTENYVEICKKNYHTYSREYAMLLQTIGAELDTFFKVFCEFETQNRKGIKEYCGFIIENNPELLDKKIDLIDYNLEIQPFKNWDIRKASQSLKWWNSFCKIKHNRCKKNFEKCNLENVLNILGALYLLENSLRKKTSENDNIYIFDEASKLFKDEDDGKSYFRGSDTIGEIV